MNPDWIQLLPDKAQAEAKAKMDRLSFLEKKVALLEEMLRLRRLERYGRKSESLTETQLWLLAEELSVSLQELEKEAQSAEQTQAVPDQEKTSKKKKHPGREPLPADLPRTEVIIPCPADQLNCSQCGQEKSLIGFETTEELAVKPAEYFVKVTKREKRACRKHPEEGVAIAPLPEKILPKSKLSDDIIIQAVINKYQWHLPIYRQVQMLERETGIVINPRTLDEGILWVGELLMNLNEPMRQQIFDSHYIQADETTVGVQTPMVKARTHRAYIFEYGQPGGMIVYDFRMGRGREGPREFLGEFWGTLQTDGYTGYVDLSPPDLVGPPRIRHAGCMAHTRRYFYKAHDADPKETKALSIVLELNKLYEIERLAKEQGLDPAGRLALRREKSVPLMADLKCAIQNLQPQVSPRSALGKACTYALNQWDRLEVFLDDGSIEIDNNSCEQSMRPIAVGRKNWMHIGAESAGPKIAAIMSVVESCRRLKINVWSYLKDVLPKLTCWPLPELSELTPLAWQRRHQEKPS